MKGATEEESPGRKMVVATHKSRVGSCPKFGLEVDTDESVHTHQEGMESFLTHIMRLSGRTAWFPSRSEKGLRG